MADSNDHRVVAIRAVRCAGDSARAHAIALVLDGGEPNGEVEMGAEDAIALINAGAVFSMIPPEGAPARAAYEATGLPLMLQVRRCDRCDVEVLFA